MIGLLTGLGSVFILYLFYTPRKVGKTNTISSIPSTNHFIPSKIFKRYIIRLQNIGRRGPANTATSSLGYFSYHLFFAGPLYDCDTDWKVPGQWKCDTNNLQTICRYRWGSVPNIQYMSKWRWSVSIQRQCYLRGIWT